MEIIPAIDMMDGKCVRLVQGMFDRSTVYGDDPAEIASAWADQGATRIHLVDLNGSKLGSPQELETVRRIASRVSVPLQLGGGIRSLDTARRVLDIGIGRVIIGTTAALDPGLAESVFQALGDQAILGVDARNGMVAVKGWEQTTSEEAISFARRMQELGARRVIYTDISRDGMMQGANIEAMRCMAEALSIPVIASGGVSSIEDIRQLRRLESVGLEGAILGKALYTGALTLQEALEA